MSSLSLPRVLHQRKTSLELERENFEKFQAASISKAINTTENPVKEKHVRIAILGTFRDKSPELFWQYVLKLPLQENRISAWKFCHVLHKLLRDGHPQTLSYSQKHKNRIEDLGKLWYHLKEGYGKLIHQYCQLLIVKLDFHQKNPGFPGNLVLSALELEKIGENDINNHFQMSIEMFDYLDEILTLQEAIFGSLDMSRSNSMTSSGQCRLAPLIQCIQDSSQLYDYCVKIMFRLYAQLPADVLSGHRARFLKQFQQLRQFYLFSSNLQYFKNLIQIPLLPENPPNILVQAELRSYVTPVVILPQQEEPDPLQISGDLIDVSDESSQNCSRSMSPELAGQKDHLIEQLQNELTKLQLIITDLRGKILFLEEQLTNKQEEVSKSKNEQQELLRRVEELSKVESSTGKLKMLEEKFAKLKDIYGKLREEHIQLIRQKADVDKQLSNVMNVDFDITERTKLEDELSTLQMTANAATEQNEALMCKMEWTEKEKSLLESKLQEIIGSKEDLEVKIKLTKIAHCEEKCLSIDYCIGMLQQTINIMTDNAVLNSIICSTEDLEYLRLQLVGELKKEVASNIFEICHLIAMLMLFARASANTSPDLRNAEKMIAYSQTIGLLAVNILDSAKHREQQQQMRAAVLEYDDRDQLLKVLMEFYESYRLIENSNSMDPLSELVEGELATMDKAIDEAAMRMQEMLKQSENVDSGIKLEVNSKILDSCTSLMNSIRVLVQKSKLLQNEIVASGNASSSNISVKEFYKRNHQWTEGLISAAKAVGMGANYLLTAANDVVSGTGKLERLIVASQGVAASTAQLVVASRVKADRNSTKLTALSVASKEVTNATGVVVGTVKLCAQLVEESDDLDFSGLSLHQAKRLEMDSQVKVLELESGLQKERLKLAALRRVHYQLAADDQI